MQKEGMLRSCRVCGAFVFSYLCDTFNEHSKTTILRNFRCQECGSVFVGNDVDGEELAVAYSTLDSNKYYEDIASTNRKKYTASVSDLKRLTSLDSSIIDIGAGDGTFVEMLRQAGYLDVSAHEIKGCDLSRISGIASKIYQDFDYETVPSDYFDAVTMLDVLEHVRNPAYLIGTCGRILKNGGIVYFHTPVVTRTDRFMHFLQRVPFARKIGSIWQRGRTSIFHLENYTPKSLTLLLERAGFRDIRIEVVNELSWPVARYIRVFLLEKQGLPGFLAPALVPFFYPLLATRVFNANKAVASARKAKAGA